MNKQSNKTKLIQVMDIDGKIRLKRVPVEEIRRNRVSTRARRKDSPELAAAVFGK